MGRRLITDRWEPISLGYACEVKHQIARWASKNTARVAPEGTDEYRQNRLVRHLFDWQITPVDAAIIYLEQDFRGVFELEDLELTGDSDVVRHRILKTRHPHEFLPADGSEVTEQTLRDLYPDARRKFDYLAERFRRRLQSRTPTLFISTHSREDSVLRRAVEALEARRSGAPTKLLVVFDQEEWAAGDDVGGKLIRDWREAATPNKPARDTWQGPDEAWDRIFGALPFQLHSPLADEPAPAPWWSRLGQAFGLRRVS